MENYSILNTQPYIFIAFILGARIQYPRNQ